MPRRHTMGPFLLALAVGAVMSFIGSMPIAGPVAVLVLERGLLQRRREGLGLALGAAAGESIYAFLAFWGVGTILKMSPAVLPISRMAGAGVLIVLGIYLATRQSSRRTEGPDTEEAGRKRRGFLL